MELESFYRALFYRAAGFRYRGIAATPMFETVSVKEWGRIGARGRMVAEPYDSET